MIFEGGKGKVGLIGTGRVGALFAYSLVQSGLASELVLVDLDEARAEGEAMDLNHAMPFARPMRINSADLIGESDRTRFLITGYDRIVPVIHRDQAVPVVRIPPWQPGCPRET